MDTLSTVALFIFVAVLTTLLILQEISIGHLYREVGAIKKTLKLHLLGVRVDGGEKLG